MAQQGEATAPEVTPGRQSWTDKTTQEIKADGKWAPLYWTIPELSLNRATRMPIPESWCGDDVAFDLNLFSNELAPIIGRLGRIKRVWVRFQRYPSLDSTDWSGPILVDPDDDELGIEMMTFFWVGRDVTHVGIDVRAYGPPGSALALSQRMLKARPF